MLGISQKLRFVILLFFGVSLPTFVVAQVSISVGHTAHDLAQKLVGQGISVFNATINTTSPASARGEFNFNGHPSDINIDSGIVLTNGSAASIPQQALFTANTSFVGGVGDPDLEALLSSYSSYAPTYDACVLEFDFVPAGNVVNFDYVFGSEEYPVYNCSWWNDVFGFFISGPGISGLENMAKVPGTNIPVSINSVNNEPNPGTPCTNMGPGSPFSQYFIDNRSNYGQYIVYNGFTTVFTATTSVVIPCDTPTI